MHRGVLILRIDLDTRLVVGHQVNMGLDMFVAGQEDVVVLIQIEFLITQGGALGKQFEPQTVGLHIDRRADAHTQFVFLVVEA